MEEEDWFSSSKLVLIRLNIYFYDDDEYESQVELEEEHFYR